MIQFRGNAICFPRVPALSVYENICLFGNGKCVKISIFKGYPTVYEHCVLFRAVSCQNARFSHFLGDMQENFQIIDLTEGGVMAIRALHDEKSCLWNGNTLPERHFRAIKALIGKALRLTQMGDDLQKEAFAVKVSARLGKSFLGALLGSQKEIVHMNDRASEAFGECTCKRGLSRSRTAVDGDDKTLAFRKLFFDMGI